MQDICGQDIAVGDTVAYLPTGKLKRLAIGVVVDEMPKTLKVAPAAASGYWTVNRAPEMMVVLSDYKLRGLIS